MKRILLTSAAVLCAQSAFGAGLDRSGQSTAALFEDGRHAEFSLGMLNPSVSGNDAVAFGGSPTGSVGQNYTSIGAAYKADFNDDISYALIFDQPYGASVEYGATSILYSGTMAEAKSSAVTALMQYNLDGGVSFYGGIRAQEINAEVTLSGAAYGALSGYTFAAEKDWAYGYVVGAAYERPEIALRVALTYSSEIEHELATVESILPSSTTSVTSPQSVNLDFQTGIAADTLVFGSVRWVNWDGFSIDPAGLVGASGSGLVSYDNNGLTYNLGVGRKINEQVSAAITIGYEKSQGGTVSALGPTDGFLSLGLGGTYTLDTGTKISGGLRYILPGDATVQSGGGTADFNDNSALGFGIKVAMPL